MAPKGLLVCQPPARVRYSVRAGGQDDSPCPKGTASQSGLRCGVLELHLQRARVARRRVIGGDLLPPRAQSTRHDHKVARDPERLAGRLRPGCAEPQQDVIPPSGSVEWARLSCCSRTRSNVHPSRPETLQNSKAPANAHPVKPGEVPIAVTSTTFSKVCPETAARFP